MALSKVTYVDGVTVIGATNLNDIQDNVIGNAADITTLGSTKVDKVEGKGLSENDFTDTLKTKLDGIQAGAQVNPGNATTSAAGLMSAADKTKLNGIANGATNVTIDNTLTQSGQAADAKATGDACAQLKSQIGLVESSIGMVVFDETVLTRDGYYIATNGAGGTSGNFKMSLPISTEGIKKITLSSAVASSTNLNIAFYTDYAPGKDYVTASQYISGSGVQPSGYPNNAAITSPIVVTVPENAKLVQFSNRKMDSSGAANAFRAFYLRKICDEIDDMTDEIEAMMEEMTEMNNKINASSGSNLWLGTEMRSDYWDIQETGDPRDRGHRAFGSVCTGRDGKLYYVFRAGFAHGTTNSTNNIGGNIYYSVSEDGGKTWDDPTLFLTAASGKDLRDVFLTYDAFTDLYILTYNDNTTDYNGNGNVVILVGSEPFVSMTDCTPATMPFEYNWICSKPVRLGSWWYFPVYGADEVNSSMTVAVIRANNGTSLYPFTNWEIVKQWTTEDFIGTESCLFISYDETEDKTRLNMLCRGPSEHGWITYTTNGGTTWSTFADIGFQCAGGPQVFELDDAIVVAAREQASGSSCMNVFLAFSYDQGETWGNRTLLSDAGPGYVTLARLENGSGVLGYCKEVSSFGHLFTRRITGTPAAESSVAESGT